MTKLVILSFTNTVPHSLAIMRHSIELVLNLTIVNVWKSEFKSNAKILTKRIN